MKYPWQESPWASLLRLLDRLPHALLIHGPAGIGKLALAEHFVQTLLCEARGAKTDPCGACEACRWFSAGHHPDVRFLEPEAIARRAGGLEEESEAPRAGRPSTEIKVDQIRDLADFLNIGSHRGAHRVALVQPAESLNAHAANALLKSLEEPPPGAVFVLVSNRSAALLPTIRSRCVAVPLGLPQPEQALKWLAAQNLKEGERWLTFAGGAPLRALEDACGENGPAFDRVLQAVASGEQAQLRSVAEREAPVILAEVLQKAALDQAFASLAGRAKYGVRGEPGLGHAASSWLIFARRMGYQRALASHPLNARLFAGDMLAALAAVEASENA